ncbi:MAG: DUF4350 domain-containing protein [Lysobacter sp.]|nr:DUF4350 domain-containing protein [Lysobacter sp.]
MSRRADAIRVVLIALVVAGLVGGFVAWWMHTYKRVVNTIDLPPKGEASYNPLYALKIALGKDGQRVDSRQRLALDDHPLKPADTLLLLGDTRTLPAADSARLLDWVEAGGHLIVRTPPPGVVIGEDKVPLLSEIGIALVDAPLAEETFVDEESSDGKPANGETAGGEAAVDETVDDTSTDSGSTCLGLQVAKMDEHTEFCDGRWFQFTEDDAEVMALWGDDDIAQYGYARVPWGEGSIDVLADLDFLVNAKLEDRPHRAFTRQLLQPNYARAGTFHLIYSANMPPLWRLLLDHAWRVLLPLLLALFVWLWMRAERLGPARPSPLPDRRSLLEHVQASGDHLYRYGRRATLYTAVHDAFLRRLRQRDPYAAALEGPAQIDAIAKRTGMTVADIEAALRYPRPGDAKDFVIRITKLLQLRKRL